MCLKEPEMIKIFPWICVHAKAVLQIRSSHEAPNYKVEEIHVQSEVANCIHFPSWTTYIWKYHVEEMKYAEEQEKTTS